MHTHLHKTPENTENANARHLLPRQSQQNGFVNRRPENLVAQKMQKISNDSLRAYKTTQLQGMADHYTRQRTQPLKNTDEAVLQGKYLPIGPKENPEGGTASPATNMANSLEYTTNRNSSAGVVQRLVLGKEGELDTKKDEDYEKILEELHSLDTDSIKYIRDSILEGKLLTKNEKIYVQVINKEIIKSRHQKIIYDLAGTHKGVWTKAAIFIDGQFVYETEAVRSGEGSGDFSHVDAGKDKWLKSEIINSERDSEVSTLSDAYDYLSDKASDANEYIQVLLTGNMGPCEGCKTRIQYFLESLRKTVKKEIWVSLEANYTTATNNVTRSDVETRYGYPDDTQKVSSDGWKYYQKINLPYK